MMHKNKYNFPVLISVIFVLMFATFSSYSYEYENIVQVQEVRRKDGLNAAFILLKKLAQENNSNAQFELGVIFERPLGEVEKNLQEAIKWYKLSAKQENAYAQYSLGRMYYMYDETRDYSESIKWFKKAAQQGHAAAGSWLGDMFYNGVGGVTKNYSEALKWYQFAAAKGCSNAQYNLGNMYYNGIGTKKDYFEAFRLYELAAEQGDSLAQYNLAVMFYNGAGTTRNYVEAYNWLKKSANQSYYYAYDQAQIMLGELYTDGVGATKNYIEAHKWFNIATTYAIKLDHQNVADQARRLMNIVEAKMTREQVAKAQSLAKVWFEEH